MTRRRRAVPLLVCALALLAVPAAASAHAGLLRTDPVASKVVDGSPAQVSLTYTEPIEPRFAIVSVTDAAGHQQTSGAPRRPSGSDTLVVPVKTLAPGWYLVFWRVISADGHPVRGAYTFAVGPNPGPSPQFVIPSVAETAATTSLVAARAVLFAALLAAIGLLAFRLLIARLVLRTVADASLRGVTCAAFFALAVALVTTPIYLDLATAQFALRDATDVTNLVPLIRASSFGRGYTDLWIVLALLTVAAGLAIRIDQPRRPQRSLAELGALGGLALAAAAALALPGLAGHPVSTSPVGIALTTDALHLLAAALWTGGLIGLLVLAATTPAGTRIEALAAATPRFSRVALASVIIIVITGTIAAILHLPTLASLWDTSYGQALLAKIILLALAMPLAGLNLARARPRLETTGDAARQTGGGRLLVRLVGGETALAAGIIIAAAILTSLAPPPKALADLGSIAATVGPGPINARMIHTGPYELVVDVTPNRAAVANHYRVTITKNGSPLSGADVSIRFTMLDMEMGQQIYQMTETPGTGTYQHDAPAFVMVGRWGVDLRVTPTGAQPIDVLLLDHAGG